METPRWSRRDFLRRGGAAAALASVAGCDPVDAARAAPDRGAELPSVVPPAGVAPEQLALDEAYWSRVAANYEVLHDPIQLENGNWGIMPLPVLARYEALTRDVNLRNSY